jgi:predicted PurR-regulated permease PerM
MHKTVGVNPVVTLLAIVAFGALFGFVGLLLAIPMAAVIQVILDRSLRVLNRRAGSQRT